MKNEENFDFFSEFLINLSVCYIFMMMISPVYVDIFIELTQIDWLTDDL